RLCPMLSLTLVNHTVALYVPTTKLLAAEFKLIATAAAGPPGVNVPPLGEAFSQTDVFASVQLSALVPALVKVKLCEVTVNGPPTPPMELKPEPGVINRASGLASALMRFCPAGVPQPVHRS